MIEREKIKSYAEKLMFRMSEEEYDTLEKEFDIILRQMKLIENIKGIENINPMIFPFVTYEAELRDDEEDEVNSLTVDEVLSNTTHSLKDQIKVPKVVE